LNDAGGARAPLADSRAMPKLRNYESEVTKLLRELVERDPAIAEDQFRGRSLWWDRRVDREAERRYRESAVPQKPYVYDSDAVAAPGRRRR
jgi:hypothetical protein